MNHPGLIASMSQPDFYPHNPDSVELIQTHISFIFIAGDLVYKVKKAVDFGFLDFTSLAKRSYFCDKEIILNRRFAPDIYIDVIDITEDNNGNLQHAGNGAVVEHALRMKRIPEEKMLHRLLESGNTTEDDIKRVGRYLARVYRDIPSDETSRVFGETGVIASNVIENFDQTRKYREGPVSSDVFHRIESWSRDFLKHHESLFIARRDGGYIKDCHGDLHLQHICIDDNNIYVFDCIEFNERFRFGDVASDVAFLSMDFDFNGRTDLGNTFVDMFINESKDESLLDVLQFYKVYRAMVRAKVISFMLDDEGLDTSVRNGAFLTAKRYYDLAYRYIVDED